MINLDKIILVIFLKWIVIRDYAMHRGQLILYT